MGCYQTGSYTDPLTPVGRSRCGTLGMVSASRALRHQAPLWVPFCPV